MTATKKKKAITPEEAATLRAPFTLDELVARLRYNVPQLTASHVSNDAVTITHDGASLYFEAGIFKLSIWLAKLDGFNYCELGDQLHSLEKFIELAGLAG